MTLRCSDVNVEPLPGTAKTGSGFVLLEHAGSWSRDVLDGGTFDPELTDQLKRHLKASGMGLQLIRKPGREGRNVEKHNLFLVFAEASIIEHLVVDSPADVLDLDLSGPDKTILIRNVSEGNVHTSRDRPFSQAWTGLFFNASESARIASINHCLA